MSSLTITSLPDICELVTDGTHDSPKLQVSGVPFIKGKHIASGRIDFDRCDFISEDDHLKCIRRVKPKCNDVLFSNIGSIGDTARVIDEVEFSIKNVALFRPDSNKIDPLYFYYLVISPNFRGHFLNTRSGSAQPFISLESFRVLRFPILGNRESQRSIGRILSAYDDLIENNRRRMALLEEAARQLYEEWFVRLRFPGHEHVQVVDGVPEGWMKKPLDDVAEFRLGKMLDQKKNKGDLMPYLANVNVRWGEFDLDNLREMRFEDNEFEAFGLKYGDIVMCEGGEPGRCAIWKDQLPRMMIQKAIHRIRARQDVDHEYLYHSLRHKAQSGQLAMYFTGATIKHLPREKLAKVKVEIPPARLMGLFAEQASPLENQINVLQTANRRACEARDLLLPRLMSGELAV